MMRVRSMMALAMALACSACGGNGSNAAAPPPATSSTSSTAAVPASSTSTTSDFGVAECDDYIKKYSACINKLAPAAQGASRQALEQSRAAWKQAAVTEQGRAALAASCKAASDAAATAMRAQGCTW